MKNTRSLLTALLLGGCTHVVLAPTPYTSLAVLTNEPVPNTWNLPQLSYPEGSFDYTHRALAREAMRREEKLKSTIELGVHDPRIPLATRMQMARDYADTVYRHNCEHHYHNDYSDCTKIGHDYPWEHKNDDED